MLSLDRYVVATIAGIHVNRWWRSSNWDDLTASGYPSFKIDDINVNILIEEKVAKRFPHGFAGEVPEQYAKEILDMVNALWK